jgi:uncharacterized protein
VTDKQDKLHYDRMMENALRGVVREALETVAATGLPGDFYVTFRTEHPGVEMPARLRQRHPEEMTIVLQHQYWDLKVEAERFGVTLSFDRVHERLIVPFAAITAFVDPSVQFGLQFPAGQAPAAKAPATLPAAKAEPKPAAKAEPAPAAPAAPAQEGGAQVVALDAFRKKN